MLQGMKSYSVLYLVVFDVLLILYNWIKIIKQKQESQYIFAPHFVKSGSIKKCLAPTLKSSICRPLLGRQIKPPQQELLKY
jgi:hypothetical protein